MKALLRRILRKFAVDIRHVGPGWSPDLTDFLVDRHVDVVLDVGANYGQFGKSLRARGYRGELVSFEPIESVFRDLQKLAQRDGNWQARKLALGSASGTAVINVSRSTDFSSLLEQTPSALNFDSNALVIRREEISVARLDDLFEPFHNRTVFLKIDTQGYERQVLDGSSEALKQIVGVQMELPIVHLYEDTWSLDDSLSYMRDRGFVLAQVTPVNWLSNDRVSLVEIDAVFRRDGSNNR
ncbi:MAG TPA: FkbM family methyltransferase [Candidatus Kapabacteria bacterium]|nr:FkbM family methyltransferase [Candidatus Kapabacteria bacterium]